MQNIRCIVNVLEIHDTVGMCMEYHTVVVGVHRGCWVGVVDRPTERKSTTHPIFTNKQYICCANALWMIHKLLLHWGIGLDKILWISPSHVLLQGQRSKSQSSAAWRPAAQVVKRRRVCGSVNCTCRGITSSSCWRTALCSCAPPGLTAPWPSSGNTLKGWRRWGLSVTFLVEKVGWLVS